MRQSRNNYDWNSSQVKEILDTIELIYAKDMLHSIWIPGTVLNRLKKRKERWKRIERKIEKKG